MKKKTIPHTLVSFCLEQDSVHTGESGRLWAFVQHVLIENETSPRKKLLL